LLNLCKNCGMPDTRPGSLFKNGVCQPCINFTAKKQIDFTARQAQLKNIAELTKARKANYDCIVAVSGGKDSFCIVEGVLKLGLKPLLVTVCDEFTKTEAGKRNFNAISEKFGLNHLIFRHSPAEFVAQTRHDFFRTLHPLKWIEEKIYKTPVNIAKSMGIPVVFFGENSAFEYGSAETLDLLHPSTTDDVSVYFYFAFEPYSEIGNLKKAQSLGFKSLFDTQEWHRQGSIDDYTQIDSIGYIIQLWTKFPKFGFQRVTDIATRMVRSGSMTRETADQLIKDNDYICDPAAKADFCRAINITENMFDRAVDGHANTSIITKDNAGLWRRKDLI
jgi:hypothetical protein